jgi:ubiquinone/menaquinone biosynthesis C-methylase UbiE
MRLYERHILPRLIDLSMRQERLVDYRRATISAARGTVVEIGVGSGHNLSLYGSPVDRVFALDPSPELLTIAESRLAEARRPVMLLRASAEELPMPDHSIDTIVTTWTLCTIRDPIEALREMRRALKPDGQLLFVEHGLAPEPRIQCWQNWLTPCWRQLGGGCHLNRKMDELIGAGGFRIDDIHTGYMKGPRPITFMYQGCAKP